MTDLKAVKGDTNIYNLRVVRSDTPVDLSDAKTWFTAKVDLDEIDADAAIALNSEDDQSQIIYTTPLQGRMQIVLNPGDTSDLVEDALYYDVQVVEQSGVITTIVSGVLHIAKDVTKTVS